MPYEKNIRSEGESFSESVLLWPRCTRLREALSSAAPWGSACRWFADAVCLVLDAYECHFEVADEFHLMGCQAAALLFGERSGSLLQHLERRRGILRIVRCGVGYRGAQEFVIRTCCFQFLRMSCLNSSNSASLYRVFSASAIVSIFYL